MQTVDESTMDDVITTIDFATLFSQEELKAKRAEEKGRRKKNGILSVENSHFLIYLICLLISIVLIAAYLFLPCAETSKWLAVLMSLGASGFGAALLAFFIDRSDTAAQDRAAVGAYNNSVAYIYSLSTGAITQCNITLLNDEQECIAYMIGDFQYGNCIAWISPDYENAFVAQEGPRPDN